MAYMKRKIKNGKIQIHGETILITECGCRDVWIQGWRQFVATSIDGATARTEERFKIKKNKDGSIPLYKKDNADSTYFRIGEGRIETPEERIEKNQQQREIDHRDQMRFTRKQWEAIEWAIDCGISAATTQFSEDKETVALVPVLQSVLDEINSRC